ncbi:MAG: YARHG domain-containing protein, partial [Tritonibacter mobilis]|nr:YARHG domain-containing protein [Tritonibacter mobilis]
MKLIVPLLALAAATPAVAGDYCADLWFTRNAIIDRAGYCFGSTLGQRLFDNGDCIAKSVSLSDADKAKVALI